MSANLAALDTLRGELFFITFSTVDVVLLGDEGLGSDGVLAGAADEALLVPLSRLVLHLLHPGLEDVPAAVTPGGKLSIVARTAVNTVSLKTKVIRLQSVRSRNRHQTLEPNCLSTKLHRHLLHRKQASCQCFSL